MARIRRLEPGGESPSAWELRSREELGRGQRIGADLPDVSLVHASVFWDGSAWWIRDCASENGTSVNGAPLVGRARHRLAAGDIVALSSARFELDDVDPPALFLLPIDDGDSIVVPHAVGVASLPSTDAPELAVMWGPTGTWSVERPDGDVSVLVNGEELLVGGRRFRAEVPSSHVATAPRFGSTRPLVLGDAEFEFGVSPREEEADLTVSVAGARLHVGERAAVYLLVVLARARGAEENRPDARVRATSGSENPDGWLTVEHTCREIGGDTNLLNVHLHRVRVRLRELGFVDANQVVERRRGRLRIAVEPNRLRIVPRR